MSDRIQVFKPVISEEAIEAVAEVLRSGWIGLGPRTERFEEHFAAFVGAPHCIALNSGTAALHVALRVLGVGPGDEVITTALTFVATNHAILYEGATPVFADIEPDTGNLDVTLIESAITDRTKAILPVHFGGYACDLEALYKLADNAGIAVIEDCAHAAGAFYKEQRIGGNGGLHAFSFHAVKNLPAGDGGALTLGDEELAERARRLRWFGISKSTFDRFDPGGYSWDYDVTEVGFKYHMNDIAAAIALVELGNLDAGNERRRAIAAMYRDHLIDIPGIDLLRSDADRVSAQHIFCILADDRDRLMVELSEKGIDTAVHYRRNDTYRMFVAADLPETESFWRRAISLPMHLGLTDSDVDRICTEIKAIAR